MGTRILLATVLALGLRGGVTASAEGAPAPTPDESRGALALGGRPSGSWKPARDLPGGDASPRRDEGREERLDALDEARLNVELLEIEVDVDRKLLVKLTGHLKQAESTSDEEAMDLKKFEQKYAQIRRDFLEKGKTLGRERRRVAELERELHLDVATPSSGPSGLRWDDAGRIADLVLRGVDAWRRASSPSSSSPADPERGDADRFLDLVREAVETLRGAPSETPPPPTSPSPDTAGRRDADRLLELLRQGVETFKDASRPPVSPSPRPSPSPSPRPDDPTLRDAEQVLELLLRGVENWQRR